MELGTIQRRDIIAFSKVEQIDRHLCEEGACFNLDQRLQVKLYLVESHWVVLFHEPGFFLVLLVIGFRVLVSVRTRVLLVLSLYCPDVALPRLKNRELLERDHWLTH